MMMAHNTLVVVLLVSTTVLLPPLSLALPPTNFRVGSRAGGSAHGPQQQHFAKAAPQPGLPRPSSPLLVQPVVSLERELTLDTTGADLSVATAVSLERELITDTAGATDASAGTGQRAGSLGAAAAAGQQAAPASTTTRAPRDPLRGLPVPSPGTAASHAAWARRAAGQDRSSASPA